MSEKHADIEFGVESRMGIPFHFLMRDVIQFDNSLEDAIWFVDLYAFVVVYFDH